MKDMFEAYSRAAMNAHDMWKEAHHPNIQVCARSFKAGKDAGFREGVAYAKSLLGAE